MVTAGSGRFAAVAASSGTNGFPVMAAPSSTAARRWFEQRQLAGERGGDCFRNRGVEPAVRAVGRAADRASCSR